MPTRKSTTRGTVRLQVLLQLTRGERQTFERLCVSELRTVGAMATKIISDHLTQRARGRSVNPVKAAPGARRPWSVQLRVTREQRRDLAAGKSIRWVAEQLGHADPALTLRVYAHVIPEEETDLSFLDFGGSGRPYTAPDVETQSGDENAADPSDRRRSGNLARPTRLELVTFRSAT